MSLWDIASTAEWGTSAKAWFGRRVLDGLVGVLDGHIEAATSRKIPAAIGCVPWLTMSEVTERLAAMPCCIVVNKPARNAHPHTMLRDLHQYGDGLRTTVLSRLADLLPHDGSGRAVEIGPYDRLGATIGPVRTAGYAEAASGSPLLHCKILVLGFLVEDDEMFTGDVFVPTTVWLGSANWTAMSVNNHMEFGLLTRDRKLVRAAYDFVLDVIAISEPLGSPSPTPQPQLMPVIFDTEAFGQIMDSFGEYAPDGVDSEDP